MCRRRSGSPKTPKIHAAIDVSDGLSLDLARLCEASGCGAGIDLDLIPIATAATELAAKQNDGSTPLDHALSDGEDFELILAVPLETARQLLSEQPLSTPLTMIGDFIAEPGLHALGKELKFRPLTRAATSTGLILDLAILALLASEPNAQRASGFIPEAYQPAIR